MAEGRLPIAKCTSLGFVEHHPKFCCIDPAACPYRGLSDERANALFLAGVISQEIDLSPLNLIKPGTIKLDYTHILYNGWYAIWTQLKNATYGGHVTSHSKAAIPIARAALGAFARSNKAEYENIVGLFESKDEFRKGLEALFVHVFNFPNPDLTDEFCLF
jgi:hypothetical protein